MMMMLCTVVLQVLLVWAWRTLDWVWFTPRRLERELRRQGLRGTNYRILYGDAKDFVRLAKEAGFRPLPLHCHDIASRVLPLFHKAITYNGIIFFFHLLIFFYNVDK
ncbi:Secologanin synthase protein [Dioscorea alata]|uniref:Secologanin synthase protein n=1 Tax=Dioscorea alata TaxID=55571 RepID=A0ACB7TUC3_DIOAL|nr:Secologanin synthase protein [Dioscorea alata]